MFWFYLYPNVYIEVKKNALIYDTKANIHYIVKDATVVSVISALLDINNMGSVLISENETNLRDIQAIVSMGLGTITDFKGINDKPVLLPLHDAINEDFDKLYKGNVSDYLLKKDVSKYLLKLSLILNDKKGTRPEGQDHSLRNTSVLTNMPSHIIRDVLSQIRYFPLQNVNLRGDNIFKHPDFNNVVNQILKMNKGVILTINVDENLEFDNYDYDKNKGVKYEFIMSDYSSLSNFKKVYEITHNTDTKFIFKVEDDMDLKSVEDIMSVYNIQNYSILPVFNHKNVLFILSLLSPNINDIFSRPISLKEIYRNKRINSNAFGFLSIDVDGGFYSGFSNDKIGDINNLSIKGCIHKELSENSAWRSVRSNGRCKDCLFQYICPPISKAETNFDISDNCGAFSD